MTSESPRVGVPRIVQTTFGFRSAKVRLTAVDSGVFTHLGPGPLGGPCSAAVAYR